MKKLLCIKRCEFLVGLFMLAATIPSPLEAQRLDAIRNHRQNQNKPEKTLIVLKSYLKYMLAHHPRSNYMYFFRVSLQARVKKSVQRKLVQELASGTPPIFMTSDRVRYGAGFSDRRTKKAVIIYDIDALKWLDKNHAEVTGGWQTGGLSSSRAIYKIALLRNHWIVTSEKVYGRS